MTGTSRAHGIEGLGWVPIAPRILIHQDVRRLLRRWTRRIASVAFDDNATLRLAEIRRSIRAAATALPPSAQPSCLFVGSLLCDLKAQGWSLRVDRVGIYAAAPVAGLQGALERKAQVRAAHLLERDAQLTLRAPRAFVHDMERRRGAEHPVSIFSLMRDGRVLGAELRSAASITSTEERGAALKACVDPYIQVVEHGAVCEHTGIPLAGIWRYFRHTWATTYNSTPGRTLWVLVRDRAAPYHPVIGIAALGSSIVQLTPRDRWIGWTGPEFVAKLRATPTRKWAQWLSKSLDRLIGDLYIRDLLRDKTLKRSELASPTTRTVARLRTAAARARRMHGLYPTRNEHKSSLDPAGATDWESRAELHLFRAKRALTLATLLDVRRHLYAAGFRKASAADLVRALQSAPARAAMQTVLRHVKAAHVGVDMMDVTVCGAVAPYNAILGGKLVAMLMASPEIAAAYNRRYKAAPSVIASSMAGREICRRPSLVLLGTTSLYDVASSQYNRIKIPAAAIGGAEGQSIRYENLGRTIGFGSYHFSRETMAALELVLARARRGRVVNSIFGEGTSPKLRKVRGAFDVVGLSSQNFMQHGSRRIIYGVALATNFHEVLLGLESKAKYILPSVPDATDRIAAYWRRRWLSPRIERPEIIDSVSMHDLTYPIRHGARVSLPEDPDESDGLFGD